MKLTKIQIEDINELRKNGVSYNEIKEKYKVSSSCIQYHTSDLIRTNAIEKSKRFFKNLSPEKKKERYRKSRIYFKDYFKRRYHNEPEYRKKFIEYVKKYNKKRKINKTEIIKNEN